MVRKPEIVVAQIGHETTSCLAQCGISVDFAFPGTLRKIKEANARLIFRQLGNALACLITNPVANNENLEVMEYLCLNPRDGVSQSLGMVVGGDQNGGCDH